MGRWSREPPAPGKDRTDDAAAPKDAQEPPSSPGVPLEAPDLTWTWIDFPDSSCRDGSTAGVAVSLSGASDKLMIFLEGGNACFDALTCSITPTSVDKGTLEKKQGLFDRGNVKNPVKDWNFVFIPYCTGDLHSGTNRSGNVPGVDGTQAFVGRLNMEAFLKRIVPTFPNPSQVLLTGRSAGAFGAMMNMDLVARAFVGTPITALDDSAPMVSNQYAPTCLLGRLSRLWGFGDSFLKDCGEACPSKDDFGLDGLRFLLRKYPTRELGLISSNYDNQITLFYGYGKNDCTGSLSTPLSASEFDAALLDLRTQMAPFPTFRTYFPASTQHTWLADAGATSMATSLYDEIEDSVPLIDWVTGIVDNEPVRDVGQ